MPRCTTTKYLLAMPAALLSGCCAFVPCHPGTWLVGTVQTLDERPIANATVTLYGKSETVNSSGCFNMHLADAMPFTFTVSAEGYKKAETKAMAGFYKVRAKLAPSESPLTSQVEWLPISEADYRSTKPCE